MTFQDDYADMVFYENKLSIQDLLKVAKDLQALKKELHETATPMRAHGIRFVHRLGPAHNQHEHLRSIWGYSVVPIAMKLGGLQVHL